MKKHLGTTNMIHLKKNQPLAFEHIYPVAPSLEPEEIT